MSPALSLQQAIRTALFARTALVSLLGGAHIFDEEPRGAKPPYITFTGIETRDWSVADQKAHEHFVGLEIVTNSRSRAAAHAISSEMETALDNAALILTDHKLISLRAIFTNVSRTKSTENFGAVLRFRAATEPL